jgi:hypothetical protein
MPRRLLFVVGFSVADPDSEGLASSACSGRPTYWRMEFTRQPFHICQFAISYTNPISFIIAWILAMWPVSNLMRY